MKNKWLFGMIVLGILISCSLVFQVWQLYRFVNAGPRFTAQDGQDLCERVRMLERYSYGYRDAGRIPLKCNYVK